jgi:hypothetical protein
MKKFTLIFFLAILVFSSCKKDLDVVKPESSSNLNDVNVPSDFNWKTSHEVQITITGFVNGLVEIASPKGVVYQRGFLQQNQPYSMKVTIPAYETAVHFLYMGQNVEVKLGAGNITHTFLKP